MRGCWVGKGTIDRESSGIRARLVLKLMNYGSGRVGEARVARRGGTWLHMYNTTPGKFQKRLTPRTKKPSQSSDLAQMVTSLA